MVGAVVSAGRRPVGGDKRRNADYHEKDGQLWCYLLLLYVYTSHQCQNKQQRTTGSVTDAWLSVPSSSAY